VVHPQSIVHSLVRLRDGALLAHLGLPDMRVPISYALHHPARPSVNCGALDLPAAGMLSFEEPDETAFPSLSIARRAGERGDAATCALNAANEVAVAAFLDGRLGFTRIPEVVAETVEGVGEASLLSFEHVVDMDARARALATRIVEDLG